MFIAAFIFLLLIFFLCKKIDQFPNDPCLISLASTGGKNTAGSLQISLIRALKRKKKTNIQNNNQANKQKRERIRINAIYISSVDVSNLFFFCFECERASELSLHTFLSICINVCLSICSLFCVCI